MGSFKEVEISHLIVIEEHGSTIQAYVIHGCCFTLFLLFTLIITNLSSRKQHTVNNNVSGNKNGDKNTECRLTKFMQNVLVILTNNCTYKFSNNYSFKHRKIVKKGNANGTFLCRHLGFESSRIHHS